jgi:hypothetical protein
VRIRRRKPWVLARRRLFGWKVRLLTMISFALFGPVGPGGQGCLVGGHRRPGTCRSRGTDGRKPPTTDRIKVPEPPAADQTRGSATREARQPSTIARSIDRPRSRHTRCRRPMSFPQPVDNGVDDPHPLGACAPGRAQTERTGTAWLTR